MFSNNFLKRKYNLFEENIEENNNKKVNLNNLLKRKNNSNNMLKRKNNDFDGNNGKVKQAKISLEGIYISEHSDIKEKAKGSIDYFRNILGGNCNTIQIGNDYKILYNKHSKEDNNKFLLSYVNYMTIKGPIIIYNIKGNKADLKKIKESLNDQFID